MNPMNPTRSAAGGAIWTIGHSSHPLDTFIGLLQTHRIECVVDVRRFPFSRRYPHHNGAALATSLTAQSIQYVHVPELGGRRDPGLAQEPSRWRNQAFRAYAAYMQTADFQRGAAAVELMLVRHRCALMCAEALWWRCHRALVADYLKARGTTVWHISARGEATEHPYTTAARLVEGRLTYAPATEPTEPRLL